MAVTYPVGCRRKRFPRHWDTNFIRHLFLRQVTLASRVLKKVRFSIYTFFFFVKQKTQLLLSAVAGRIAALPSLYALFDCFFPLLWLRQQKLLVAASIMLRMMIWRWCKIRRRRAKSLVNSKLIKRRLGYVHCIDPASSIKDQYYLGFQDVEQVRIHSKHPICVLKDAITK